MNPLKKAALYSALIGGLAFGGNALAQEGLGSKLNSTTQNSAISYIDSLMYKYRNNLFSKLKSEISEDMSKYPFIINAGNGGNWVTSMPSEISAWDDYSDLEQISFEGINIGNNSEQRIIVHEYFHGIWDIFGAYSSCRNRLINRDQFRKDTERFMSDELYKNNSYHQGLRECWGVNNSSEERMQELQKMFPNDFSIGDKIPLTLTERFASLSEIYFENPDILPNYLSRHFKPFFK